MLFFIRLSNSRLLELILTTSKYLLIIELMTFNAKTRIFYNRALLLLLLAMLKKTLANVILHSLVKLLVVRINFNKKQISIDNRANDS